MKAARRGDIGRLLQAAQLGRVECDIDGAGALIVERGAAVGADCGDKLVVQLEAARRQREQRVRLTRLEVGCENACGRLRGAEPSRPLIDKLDRRTAPGKLVGHRAADNPGTDHYDVAAHPSILAGR